MARALAIIAILAGYVVLSATEELLSRAALWWLDHKPFSPEAKARRKAKRDARRAKREGPLPDLEVFPPDEEIAVSELWKSHGRSTLKALGAVLVTLGIADVGSVDAVLQALELLIGAASLLYGVYSSHKTHQA